MLQKLISTGIKMTAIQDNSGACPKYLIMDGISTFVTPAYACCIGSFHFSTFVTKHVVLFLLIKSQ
jgi:hypothetical protein